MDERKRNLRAMLAEAKDTSELMVDLAYAALYFGDPGMAEEVGELEEAMSELVHDMRAVCVLAARTPEGGRRDGLGPPGDLQRSRASPTPPSTSPASSPTASASPASSSPTSPTPRRSPTGCGCARTATSPGGPLADLELPVQCGMRVVAIRRGREWITDVDGDVICIPGDVLFLRGSPAGIHRLRELAAAPPWEPPTPPEDGTLTDLDRAVDVLVEMKNISETAVGLAYSALVLRDQGLAAEVRHLEDRLDEMKDRLELWVLRAAGSLVGTGEGDPAPLRGLLHLSQAAEALGDQAQHMVWLVEQKEELHPILALALGESDDVVVRVPVGAGSRADGVTLASLRLDIEPGFHVLAIRRGGRYVYRPGGDVALLAGDELIASGPDEGHPMLTELLGWRLDEDEETGEQELVPLTR